jgi:3-deoxy-D-manno-octulosonic-acid transferase
MILFLYRLLTTLGGPLVGYHLQRRVVRGKEDAARLGERTGVAGQERPDGPLVWLHSASVGEAVSMLPVIKALQARYTVLVTTGTVTSAAMMAERLPEGAIHQFVPVDRIPWVRRFLVHWRPDLALWSESEFWPNLLIETAARRIPMILLNGRISERSFRRWQRVPDFIRRLLAGFVLCIGQSEEDARRLSALGAGRTACVGNLKFSAPVLPADEGALAELRAALGDRPRWLAASTHAGEEALAGRVHAALDIPGLVTIIVPRHPKRGAEIAADLEALGLKPARRSLGEPIGDVYIADTMGELGLFYRVAPLVFIGKSLIGRGGQNPLEPARLGASVLFGPHMGNFVDIAARMQQAGAAKSVAAEGDLVAALSRRLADPTLVAIEGLRAVAFASAQDDVLAAVMKAITPWLPLRDPGGE